MESVIEQFCGGGLSLLILFTPPSMATFSIVEKKLYLKHAIKFSLRSPRMPSLINPLPKKSSYLLGIRETYHKIVFYYDAVNVAMINVETDSSEF